MVSPPKYVEYVSCVPSADRREMNRSCVCVVTPLEYTRSYAPAVVGKLGELVIPATIGASAASNTTRHACSRPEFGSPPRYVPNSGPDPSAANLITYAS